MNEVGSAEVPLALEQFPSRLEVLPRRMQFFSMLEVRDLNEVSRKPKAQTAAGPKLPSMQTEAHYADESLEGIRRFIRFIQNETLHAVRQRRNGTELAANNPRKLRYTVVDAVDVGNGSAGMVLKKIYLRKEPTRGSLRS